MRKITLALSVAFLLTLSAVMVYAWATESDGGFEPTIAGSCNWTNSTTNGSLRDDCVTDTVLNEAHKTGGPGAGTHCTYTEVLCDNECVYDGGSIGAAYCI